MTKEMPITLDGRPILVASNLQRYVEETAPDPASNERLWDRFLIEQRVFSLEVASLALEMFRRGLEQETTNSDAHRLSNLGIVASAAYLYEGEGKHTELQGVKLSVGGTNRPTIQALMERGALSMELAREDATEVGMTRIVSELRAISELDQAVSSDNVEFLPPAEALPVPTGLVYDPLSLAAGK